MGVAGHRLRAAAVKASSCNCPGHRTYGQGTMVISMEMSSADLRLLLRWEEDRGPSFAFQMPSQVFSHQMCPLVLGSRNQNDQCLHFRHKGTGCRASWSAGLEGSGLLPAAEPGLWETVHRGRGKGASTPPAATWGKGSSSSITSSTAHKLDFTHG